MPLNILKSKSSRLYDLEHSKYEGRESVTDITIPGLGKWNDVLHLSPIHPAELKRAFVEAGGDPDNFPTEWYQIPVQLIRPESTMLMRDDAFLKYDPGTLADEAHIPEETQAHYQKRISAGERPFLFEHASHVLFKGTVPLSECAKIEV